jgi:hypothetical protein
MGNTCISAQPDEKQMAPDLKRKQELRDEIDRRRRIYENRDRSSTFFKKKKPRSLKPIDPDGKRYTK